MMNGHFTMMRGISLNKNVADSISGFRGSHMPICQ